MAFDEWPRGGDPFNVRNDVAAWQVVMDSPVPLTVADGEVTKRSLTLTRKQAKDRFKGPLGEYLVAIQTRWLDRMPRLAQQITGSPDAWPVWDIGAVAVPLGLAKVKQHPRPTLRDDRTFDHAHPRGTIGWVTSIEGEKLWAEFASSLKMP
jgi:hypothetical protein